MKNALSLPIAILIVAGLVSLYLCGYRVGYVEGAVDMAVGLANTETNIVHSAEAP